jgi:hypothetical protein
MPHCAVPLCTNGSRKTQGTDISYHRLPNGPLKSVWLRNIRRENPRQRSNTFVCSAHFTPDSFEPSVELIPGFKKPKKLKPSAVPTLFAFPSKLNEVKTRPSSERQIRNRARQVCTHSICYFYNDAA